MKTLKALLGLPYTGMYGKNVFELHLQRRDFHGQWQQGTNKSQNHNSPCLIQCMAKIRKCIYRFYFYSFCIWS